MNIPLIVFAIGGVIQAFRQKKTSHRIFSVAMALYSVALVFWDSKPTMGIPWLFLFAPFAAYLVWVKWQSN